jgi:hypothetical protein
VPQTKPAGKPLALDGARACLAAAISRGLAIPAADNPAIFANWRRETLSDIDAAPERIVAAAQWRVGGGLKSGGVGTCGCRIAGRSTPPL